MPGKARRPRLWNAKKMPLAEWRRRNNEERARSRAKRKIRNAAEAEQARLRGDRRVWLNSSGLVAMRLCDTLRIHLELGGGTHVTLPAETEIWVPPGSVADLERRGLAQEVQKPTRFGAAVITGRPPDMFESPEHEPPKERTAAGY